MRLLVVSDLPQFVTGGAEFQAARLIEAWLDQGHEVVCCGRRMGPGPVAIGRHHITVHRIRTFNGLGRVGRALSYWFSLSRILLQYRKWADLIYTRFLGEAALTAALLKMAGMLRTALVATPANTGGAGDLSSLKTLPCSGLLIKLLDQHCDAINLIAPDMANELRYAGFSGKNFSKIPNGIALRPLSARAEHAWPTFVAVGRLAPQKGYDLLLDALASIRGELHRGQIRIVGDGPEREALQARAEALGISGLIEWLGDLPQEHVQSILCQSHVFLLPSRYEGLSNAGIEAMASGLPLVITQCGGLDHYVLPTMGWVIGVGDVEALAAAVASALRTSMPDLLRMGSAARIAAETHFDMKVISTRYLELFQSILAGAVRGA